jgi:hypothetical protein
MSWHYTTYNTPLSILRPRPVIKSKEEQLEWYSAKMKQQLASFEYIHKLSIKNYDSFGCHISASVNQPSRKRITLEPFIYPFSSLTCDQFLRFFRLLLGTNNVRSLKIVWAYKLPIVYWQRVFSECTCLTKLSLVFDYTEQDIDGVIANTLSANSSLRALKLQSDRGERTGNFIRTASMLCGRYAFITHLEFSTTRVTNTWMLVFARVLRINHVLQSLLITAPYPIENMDNITTTDALQSSGIVALANALYESGNSVLTHLALPMHTNDDIENTVATALMRLRTLTHLTFCWQQSLITADSVSMFLDAIRCNSTLRELKIEDVHYTYDALLNRENSFESINTGLNHVLYSLNVTLEVFKINAVKDIEERYFVAYLHRNKHNNRIRDSTLFQRCVACIKSSRLPFHLFIPAHIKLE